MGHLCRPAKQSKATHPGRKIEIEVPICRCFSDELVEWFKSGEVMLKLKEDANVVVAV